MVSLFHASFLKSSFQVRSIFLRGFDQDMANQVGDFMETEGVKFVRKCVPTKIERIEEPKEGEAGLYKVWGKYNNGDEYCDEFNTSEWRPMNLHQLLIFDTSIHTFVLVVGASLYSKSVIFIDVGCVACC